MLAAAVLLAISGEAYAELCRADAVDIYKQLLTLASMGRYESERAAFLVRAADGRLTSVVWQAGDHAEASYTGRIPSRCIAVIHTHPVGSPLPSKHDVIEAQRIGLPIVVITPQSVTVATPQGTARIILTARELSR